MSKHKSNGKDKKKGSQLVIRVEKAERDAFVALCDRLDTSAAREIRRFMRDLVATHSLDAAKESEPLAEVAVADAKPAEAEPAPEMVTAKTETVPQDAVAGEAEKPKKKQRRAAL